MAKEMLRLYRIKPETFEIEKSEDPFGFSAYVEKEASRYIPFSGSVQKPSYFYFVTLVDYLLEQPDIQEYITTARQRKIAKTRLEKLLVLCWRKDLDARSRKRVIGVSKLKNLDPFSESDWVKQNCFKIYTYSSIDSLFRNVDWSRFWQDNLRKNEYTILKKFLMHERMAQHENYINEFIKKLRAVNGSLFSNEVLTSVKFINHFKKHLGQVIVDKRLVKLLKQSNPVNIYKEKERILKSSPFCELNAWFSSVILAVDVQVNSTQDSASRWKKAEINFNKLDEAAKRKFKRYDPDPQTWFERRDRIYSIRTSGEDKYNKKTWKNSIVKQAEKNPSHLYTFRLEALSSLVEEVNVKRRRL